MSWDAMTLANVASCAVLLAAAVYFVRTPGIAAFLGLTGGAWLVYFLPGGDTPFRVLFSLLLICASVVLVVLALRHGNRHAWIAAGLAILMTVTIFVGRGASAIMDSPATVVARAARDINLGAYVFALVLFALAARWQNSGRLASVGLLLYPGVVAGIYLHPESHRIMLGLAGALLLTSILWIRNTHTTDAAASRQALLVALLALALPLIALATVRLQGGLDGASHGPLRALARTAGPLVFAAALARSSGHGSHHHKQP